MNTPKEADHSKLEQVILRRINTPTEYPAVNHIRLTKAYRGMGEGELTVTAGSLNPQKIVHGGCLYSLADTVCGAAAASNGHLCVTTSSSINFLRPGKSSGKIYCSAIPEKTGRRISVYRFEIYDDTGGKDCVRDEHVSTHRGNRGIRDDAGGEKASNGGKNGQARRIKRGPKFVHK